MQAIDFKIGDTVKISFKSIEEKSKAPSFEGVVIALRGEKGSMSEMVREAMDAYIVKRNRTEGE